MERQPSGWQNPFAHHLSAYAELRKTKFKMSKGSRQFSGSTSGQQAHEKANRDATESLRKGQPQASTPHLMAPGTP